MRASLVDMVTFTPCMYHTFNTYPQEIYYDSKQVRRLWEVQLNCCLGQVQRIAVVLMKHIVEL